MNEYDSDRIAGLLKKTHGLEVVYDADDADVILMNTCSIREKAQEKVFTQLGVWKHWKNERSGRLIGVGGCVASQEGEAIRQRAPFVDVIFGPQSLHRLPAMIDAAIDSKKLPKSRAQIDISFPEIEKFDNLPKPEASGVTAFVSVMEGCSKYCSFCVVPYTRGEEVSRPFHQVIEEVQIFADQGVREVTLLGQNVNAYRGASDDGTEIDLAALIDCVAAIEGIDRIRFTTSHPMEMTQSLIDVFAQVPELVSHLHLPVQSGSDRILQLMKRGHTALEYKNIIRRLRKARADIQLSSDFIIGFPGETEEDFQQTMALIEQVQYDRAFSFIYSARPGTPAADMADDVPLSVKKQRLYAMQALLNEQANAVAQSMLGTQQWVLVERLSRNDINDVAGRTQNNIVVNFSGNPELIGTFVAVEITSVFRNSLRGRLIEKVHEMDRNCLEL